MTPALDDGAGEEPRRTSVPSPQPDSPAAPDGADVPTAADAVNGNRGAAPDELGSSELDAAARFGVSPDLPHTDRLAPMKLRVLKALRKPAFFLVSRWWRVDVIDEQLVPDDGPVILAANHIGGLDGPVLIGATHRLALAMAKHELFTGRLGYVLNLIGQVPVNRRTIDLRGIRRSVQVLRNGLALAVFPEGLRTAGEVEQTRGGAVYLAMITGAAIVPVAILGTRPPGTTKGTLPPRRSRIEVVFGEPFRVPRVDWPRRKAVVAQWNEVLRDRLAAHVHAAVARTGVELPGPPRRMS